MSRLKREFDLINKICGADIYEGFLIYKENREILKDWMFIGCDSNNINQMKKIIHTQRLYDECFLLNFFKYIYIYVIDYRTTLQDKILFFLDYSVSLDTQILSYIKRYLFNPKENIPKNFLKVLNYLILNNINVDPFEYLYENYDDFNSRSNDILMTLYAYEVFKNLNVSYWKSNYLLTTDLTHKEIIKKVNEEIDILKDTFNNIKEYRDKCYNLTYICLLKMIIIELTYSRRKWEFKLDLFLRYLNYEVGLMVHREIIIAKEYFYKGHNLGFFKKINKNMKEPIKIIKNMAWDLFHIRNIERNKMAFSSNNIYFVPCFLTYDKNLAEIVRLCSIKKMAINETKRSIVVCYDEMEEIRRNELFNKWFTDESFNKRQVITDLESEVKKLEQELLKIIN